MVLVAYYSHTGATRRIAALMAEHLSADICELVPDPPYAADYKERAKREKRGGYASEAPRRWRDASSMKATGIGGPK